VEQDLEERSPLQQHDDIEKSLKDKWESELAAGIESEYRRQRVELVRLLQMWMRDVWLRTRHCDASLLSFPDLEGTKALAGRITDRQALANLDLLEQTQRLLHTNVQEALALEISLLKLRL
jgi:hypothetical protein